MFIILIFLMCQNVPVIQNSQSLICGPYSFIYPSIHSPILKKNLSSLDIDGSEGYERKINRDLYRPKLTLLFGENGLRNS